MVASNGARADEPDTSAPPGIMPTAMTLTQLIARTTEAVGRVQTGVPHTRREQWKITFGSLNGSRAYLESGPDFRNEQTLGPARTAEGRSAGKTWRMNANEQVSVGSNLHREDDVDAAALHSNARGGAAIIGQVSTPVDSYVVRVDPQGGRFEYRFYDRKTFLLDRIEEIRDGRRGTIVFSDYRTTKGLTEPWHVHTSDGFTTNDGDEVLQSLAIGGAVAPSELSVPPNGAPIISLTGSPTNVPIVMSSDVIVVPVRMGGHKVDFILDSGADGIVIDKGVVEALKIPEYGRITSETAGTYVESDIVIPAMLVGDLSLQNVHARSLPFTQWTDTGTPVAGLLGYDFIHDVVWHIDYMKGTLEAIAPNSFVPPPGAHAFSVTFDDNVPTVVAAIGGAPAPAFILDTGADRSIIFSRFADAHPQQIVDLGLGTQMRASFPFVNKFSGVGGAVESRPIQAGPLALGPWTFPKWLFQVTQDAASFEFEDYDGLLGQDLLRNFDVYLDYPHSKVYLLPNERFRQRW